MSQYYLGNPKITRSKNPELGENKACLYHIYACYTKLRNKKNLLLILIVGKWSASSPSDKLKIRLLYILLYYCRINKFSI